MLNDIQMLYYERNKFRKNLLYAMIKINFLLYCNGSSIIYIDEKEVDCDLKLDWL